MRKLKLDELGRSSLEEYRQKDKTKITLILDNIRSAMNVGSFFRTADAFALEKIILCGITACPPHPEINKTAIGADHSVDWVYVKDITTAVNELKKEGYQIIGIEQTDESQLLQHFTPTLHCPFVLIFGNEVNGLSDAILPLLDNCLEIPQLGTKHSLNVSVSAGIVIWHFMQSKI